MRQTCYMCDAESTSSEHAPPKCFFPEAEVAGKDLRKNLITVPSCDLHNSKKAKDDEFLRAVILLAAGGGSGVAKAHFFDKVLRAAARRPHAHLSFVTPIGLRLELGEICSIDRQRFDRSIKALGYALHLYEFGEKLRSPLNVASPNLYAQAGGGVQVPQAHQAAIDATRAILASEPVRGENPEVFMYRVGRDMARTGFGFAAVFYETFEVFGGTYGE